MYCPNCAALVIDDEMQYCTACGHDLSGRLAMRKGYRHAFILLGIGMLLIPVWMFIGPAFPAADRIVESHPSTTWLEQIAWIAMWMSFIAAGIRFAFAHAFEKSTAISNAANEDNSSLSSRASNAALPSADGFQPASSGRWRTAGELAEPLGVKPRTSGRL